MNLRIEKRCIICKKPFQINTARGSRGTLTTIRNRKSKTCSKECSKTYCYITNVVRTKLRKQIMDRLIKQ